MYCLSRAVEPLKVSVAFTIHNLIVGRSDYNDAQEEAWSEIPKLNMDQNLIHLLEALMPRLLPRAEKRGKQGGTGSSSSSSSSKGTAARNNRSVTAANALRLLNDRRQQASPYPLLIISLVGSAMAVLTIMLATVPITRYNKKAGHLLLLGNIFLTLDAAAYYLLQCSRDGGISTNDPIPDIFFNGHENLLLQAIINTCMAACHALSELGSLSAIQQRKLVSDIPKRFLEVLTTLAQEGLASSKQLEAQQALLMVATLPCNVGVHHLIHMDDTPHSSESLSSSNTISCSYATRADSKLSLFLPTDQFLSMACGAFISILPVALPIPPLHHKGKKYPLSQNPASPPDRRSQNLLLGDIFYLLSVLKQSFEEIAQRKSLLCAVSKDSTHNHAKAAQLLSAVARGNSSKSNESAQIEVRSYHLTRVTFSVREFVLAVCRLGAHCAAHCYLLPTYLVAAAECVTLLLAVLDLESQTANADLGGLYALENDTQRYWMEGPAKFAVELAQLLRRQEQSIHITHQPEETAAFATAAHPPTPAMHAADAADSQATQAAAAEAADSLVVTTIAATVLGENVTDNSNMESCDAKGTHRPPQHSDLAIQLRRLVLIMPELCEDGLFELPCSQRGARYEQCGECLYSFPWCNTSQASNANIQFQNTCSIPQTHVHGLSDHHL